MKEGRLFFKFFLIVSLIVFAHGFAISFPEPQIEVEITDPEKNGMKVGKEMTVEGTASIPSGKYLWVLVHRIEGFEDVWWPQNEGKINPVTMKWKVLVVFGGPQDIGYEFAIAAIVVEEREHLQLRTYRINGMRTEEWPPIPMPPTVPGFPPVIKKVKKAGH